MIDTPSTPPRVATGALFRGFLIIGVSGFGGVMPFAHRMLVEHRRWPSQPGKIPQNSAYEDAVRRCATRWILFVDADEFLRLIDDRDIHQFLARFPDDVSAVAISWRVFGPGGLDRFEPAPVIERFGRKRSSMKLPWNARSSIPPG